LDVWNVGHNNEARFGGITSELEQQTGRCPSAGLSLEALEGVAVPIGELVGQISPGGRVVDEWVRHIAISSAGDPSGDTIARLLRGEGEGPEKTGSHLQQLWCAILGLNQLSSCRDITGNPPYSNLPYCRVVRLFDLSGAHVNSVESDSGC
jgi:hypothetical protein